MKLGLVSIQRNRAKYLTEWFAFHYVVGFRKFYFYAHLSEDGTAEVVSRLSGKLDIKAFGISEKMDRVQLSAYQHTCDHFMDEVDWMAFIDGDEFLFPTNSQDFQTALKPFESMNISAVAAFNINFGSSGHISDPSGLVIENYTRCSLPDFLPNRRVKSIVKGHQKVSTTACSNVFNTPHGTVDEQLRPITWGYMPDYIPSYEQFRFNHYVCQSREFYESFKKQSGHADAGSENIRGEDWWTRFDTNQVENRDILKFRDEVLKTMAWLEEK